MSKLVITLDNAPFSPQGYKTILLGWAMKKEEAK
jgi:hypothetical protein